MKRSRIRKTILSNSERDLPDDLRSQIDSDPEFANFLVWNDSPAEEDDFAAYRVYLAADDGDFLLGETDSPGFVDLLAINGTTFSYFVTSLDDQGHESAASGEATVSPLTS